MILSRGCAGDDSSHRICHKRFSCECEAFFRSNSVGQGTEVTVLETRHLKFRFENPCRPFADRSRLRYHHDFGAFHSQGPSVFREMPVIAYGHSQAPDRSSKHRDATITRIVEVRLVVARTFHDVNHARHTQQTPVRIQHGRRVVGALAVPFIEVEDGHNTEPPDEICKKFGRRTWDGLRPGRRLLNATALREKGEKCHLGENDQLSALGCGLLQRQCAPLSIRLPIGRGMLLNECDLHISPFGGKYTRILPGETLYTRTLVAPTAPGLYIGASRFAMVGKSRWLPMKPGNTDTAAAPKPTPFTWVSSVDTFQRMVEFLVPASRMAIDIEADSLYHYFEKVCLIQISTDRETFILDPLAVKDLSAIGPIMADAAVEKVFHAATYDLFCLRRDYSFSFKNLFDTHIAAQFLGHEQLGLDALLEKLMGIEHSKRRQRDDWSRRPLAPEQLEYAAMDTHHLLQLRDLLEQQLREKRRLPWACEEFDCLAEVETQDREFDPEGFRRIKGSRDLSFPKLAVLRALYLLRDRYARELNVPPFKVLNNSILLDLAQHPPRSPREMFKRPGISFRVARRFAGEIFRIIERAHLEDPAALVMPARNAGKTPSRESKARLEELRRWRRTKGEELQLHVGVVFPGTLLEALAAFPPSDMAALESIPGMRRWRAHEFGQDLLHILQPSD
jgi:ribonuclease D